MTKGRRAYHEGLHVVELLLDGAQDLVEKTGFLGMESREGDVRPRGRTARESCGRCPGRRWRFS